MEKEATLAAVTSLLRTSLPLVAAYLFGSRAGGQPHEQSDYDLALLYNFSARPSFQEKMVLQARLEELLKQDVDLIWLNEVGPVIAIQAVTKGTLLLENSREQHLEYITHLFSQYAEFKEMRQPMERNILQRKYYGG